MRDHREFDEERECHGGPEGPHHHRGHCGRHHGPHRFEGRGPEGHPHREAPAFDEEFFEKADTEFLLHICAHEMRFRKPRFGATQDRILKILNEGDISQRELQEKLHIRPGSVSEILSKMEERGLLERQRDEEDRRQALLKITEDGRKAAESIVPQEEEKILTEEEEAELKALLKKMILTLREKREERKKREHF